MVEGLPSFSILMSVYSKERPSNLYHALTSIVQQTVKPQEIVLVKDGPLGKALDSIIDNFANRDPSLKVVTLPRNVGLARALNAGLKQVKYNLVARMDSDDISVKNRFEIQTSYFKKDSELALLGGQLSEFEDGNLSNIIGRRAVPVKQRDIIRFAKYRSPFNHPTVMFKKNVVEQVGEYEKLDHLEDYLLWAKIISGGYKFANCPDVLLLMRSGDALYGRRSGWSYFKNYVVLRRRLRSLGIVNSYQMIVGDVALFVSSLTPNWIRKILYRKFLHKN